jgi:glycosyltransferase involved in cell wall biosynthesis
MDGKYTFFLFAYWHDPKWEKFVGASVKIWDLANNLHSIGHEVFLFLPKYNFKTSKLAFKVIEVPFLDFPIVRLLSFNLILLFMLLIKFFIKRPDVVYVRRMTSVIPLLYAKIFKKAFFYEVNDDPYNSQYHQGSKTKFLIKSFLSTKIDEVNLRFCDRTFIISQNLLKKICDLNPFMQVKKMIVTHSGANTQLFKPKKKLECRVILKLALSNKYIGFVGTLLKHQGLDNLIKAAPQVLSQEPLCKFVLIGEGPMKKKWIDKVEREGLSNSFLFPGQVKYEKVAVWLGAMDICVAPFLKEAGLRSPVKLFDYMACGRPVVASKISGSTDIFENSGAVKLIKPEDPAILADTILDLLVDENKAQQIGKKGREIVVAQYDRKILAKKISDVAKSSLEG